MGNEPGTTLRRLLLPAYLAGNRLVCRLQALGTRPRGTLVYVGMHRGLGFDRLFRAFETCIGIEANPELFEALVRRYRRFTHVQLFNLAAATEAGWVELNVSSNDGKSSSLGEFRPEWRAQMAGGIHMARRVRVPAVNLCTFLQERGIHYIDYYLSDIQGMDLAVLKTLRPYIERRAIGRIQCEVAKDGRRNVYAGLEPNDLAGFTELLSAHYDLAGTGWGRVRQGRFRETPASWWEFDGLWTAKPDAGQATGKQSGPGPAAKRERRR